MGYRLVRNVPSIQPNGFSVEEVGHSLVGRIRVAQRAGCQKQPGSKVFTEFAFRAEAHTEAGPVAIQARSAILKDAFAAQSDVAAEPDRPSTSCSAMVFLFSFWLLPFPMENAVFASPAFAEALSARRFASVADCCACVAVF